MIETIKTLKEVHAALILDPDTPTETPEIVGELIEALIDLSEEYCVKPVLRLK